MLSAEHAFAKSVMGTDFYKLLTKAINKAVANNELFIKIDAGDFPGNRNTDDILKAITALGYRFSIVEGADIFVLDFSLSWLDEDEQVRNS